MSNKPQVVTTPENVTDTVVSTTNQDVKNARPTPSARAVNAYGVTVLRGGNVLGSSLLDSVIDAYTNVLSYQPVALVLLLISLLYYISKILQQETINPFLMINNSVSTAHSEETNPGFKALVSFFKVLARLLVSYEKYFALLFSMSFPYLTKPSSRNAITAFLLFIYCVLSKASYISILFLSQLFFLLVQLRSPKHKAIIILIAVLGIIFGNETLTVMSQS